MTGDYGIYPGAFSYPIERLLQQLFWLSLRPMEGKMGLDDGISPSEISSIHLYIQGPENPSRVLKCINLGSLININFPQSFTLALIGCRGAHASVQPRALHCATVQTYCTLCVKIRIFYIWTTLNLQNAFMWLPLAFQVQHFFWGIIGSGLQGVPVTICCCLIDICFICAFI